MSDMRSAIATAVLVLTVAGCGGGGGGGGEAVMSAQAAPPSVTPSPTALRVGLGGICPELVKTLQQSVDLVTESQKGTLTHGQATGDRFDAVLSAFAEEARLGPENLVPYIDQQVTSLKQVKGASGGGTGGFQISEYRAAARELLSQCGPFA